MSLMYCIFHKKYISLLNQKIIMVRRINGNLCSSHRKTNSCGVLIAFLGDISFTAKNKVNDCNGRILILETRIDNPEYLLVKLYNSSTES